MTDHDSVTTTDRVNGAFVTGHDRLDEFRHILGIIPPRVVQDEQDRAAQGGPSEAPQGSAGEAARGAPSRRTVAFDLRDPAVVLLAVFWTAFIGLLTSAIVAMR